MKSKEQIKKRIEEIESMGLGPDQVGLQGEVIGLRWVLEGNVYTNLPVKWTLVESSNIMAIGYNEEARELHIQFSSGTVYAYFEVPSAVYQGFLAAESKGKYLGAHIKGVFEYRKV